MKKQIVALMLMVMFMAPASTMAMKGMDHGNMDNDGGMSMGGDMIMLKDVEVDGVMASTHLMDTSAKMAKHGMSVTHHIMVGFMNSEGATLDKGQVAIKVQGPDGKTGKTTRMMGMSGAFGADITLDQKGMYMFNVGTKLADGKKRMFMLHYDNK